MITINAMVLKIICFLSPKKMNSSLTVHYLQERKLMMRMRVIMMIMIMMMMTRMIVIQIQSQITRQFATN